MIDYKNYKVTKTNKEQSDYASKNGIWVWIIFTLITILLWITTIEMLFK
jgi:hypothetical protein